jgi:hypothetical protein
MKQARGMAKAAELLPSCEALSAGIIIIVIIIIIMHFFSKI